MWWKRLFECALCGPQGSIPLMIAAVCDHHKVPALDGPSIVGHCVEGGRGQDDGTGQAVGGAVTVRGGEAWQNNN